MLDSHGLQVNKSRIEKQVDTGYKIIQLPDRLSQYSVDFILESKKKLLTRRKGTALGEPVYYDSPDELILAKARMIKATVSPVKAQKDREDIKNILANTRVNIRSLLRRAKLQSTNEILQDIVKETKSSRT
jgi:hypothetical protein